MRNEEALDIRTERLANQAASSALLTSQSAQAEREQITQVITTSGVASVAGTTNQVLVNGGTAAATGDVTLSAPQNLHSSATPRFASIGLGVAAGTAGITQDSTITAGGTTGAQTINKASGTVNFAAAATSLVVTNNLVTTSSFVFAIARTNDATALVKNVVPASGSFTINLNAAATAETSVGFLVIN